MVWFYNMRGTAEQWIKEGKQTVKMRRLPIRLGLAQLQLNELAG